MTWTLVAQISTLILVTTLSAIAVVNAVRTPRAPRG
jgi:hypothetical protein